MDFIGIKIFFKKKDDNLTLSKKTKHITFKKKMIILNNFIKEN